MKNKSSANIGQKERNTQNRIVALLQNELGYHYLGNWEDRVGNSNIEEELLRDYLLQNYEQSLVNQAINKLKHAASDQSKKMYYVNQNVYQSLRYGVSVQPDITENSTTLQLIDWQTPTNNHFGFAEEVTIKGKHTKRPDIVLYINGIAIATFELKRSTKGIEHGIRQNLDNQKKEFIHDFFSTIQLVLAGNDHQGIRYGTTGTPEKFYLQWKEVSRESNPNADYLLKQTQQLRQRVANYHHRLDKDVIRLLSKERIMELMYNFIVFDAGVKKICRPNQYFGVKAGQEYIRKKEGGIIWHTQGSGKSLTMVWLAKWIREYNPNARLLIITDRTELDEQIEKVFHGVSEELQRAKSGRHLLQLLNEVSPWLMGSLVHKFGSKDELTDKDVDKYVKELKHNLPSNFSPKGDMYVFVDECHRTQSGKLHAAMKSILPEATIIGFTGTPLLKKDKQTSLEVFGPYIHTYKFNEAVDDGVVLDLRYEARDIDQEMPNPERVDAWFENKTKDLTDYAKAELKSRWGTIKKVYSSEDRLDKIVADICFDMSVKPRLSDDHGNAMLVSDSVYNACRYYELFRKANFKKCAIVTSYQPHHSKIKGEETGAGVTESLKKYEVYQQMLNGEDPDVFEKRVKKEFIENPGQMKLLIVVDKLLTGFDAPPATYLYIDKSMSDHGLFQAICRVNRLDDNSKEYGYIVDYKDLFKSLEKSIEDYTSEALSGYDKEDVQGLLKNRLEMGRNRLDDTLEAVKAMVEPVEPPKGQFEYQRYFIGNPENKQDIKEKEGIRHQFYKAVSRLVRAYANASGEMQEMGYPNATAARIKQEVNHFQEVKDELMLAADEYIDLKQYEPDMRQLIDFHLSAKHSRTISHFEDMGLIDLIVNQGEDGLDQLPDNIKNDREAMAEAIENNVRKVIIEQEQTNPKYFEKMSLLLGEIIVQRREKALEYEEYLKKIVELSQQVKQPEKGKDYPKAIHNKARIALYENLEKDEELTVALDEEIRYKKMDGWRDNPYKMKQVRRIIEQKLNEHGIVDPEEVKRIMSIVKNQEEY